MANAQYNFQGLTKKPTDEWNFEGLVKKSVAQPLTPEPQLQPLVPEEEPLVPEEQPGLLGQVYQKGLKEPVSSLLAGVTGATAGTARVLDTLAGKVSELTGLPKGGLFENISNEFSKVYQHWKEKGIKDDDALSKTMSTVYEGLGMAAVEVPKLMASGPGGLAVWGGLGGAAEAIEKKEPILPAAAKGALKGQALRTALKATGYLPRGLGEAAAGAVFGGPSLVEELQKKPEERNWGKVVGETLTGVLLTANQRRIPWSAFLEAERDAFRPFNAMPRWEKKFYGPLLKTLKTKSPDIYKQVIKMPSKDRSGALRGYWDMLYEMSRAKQAKTETARREAARRRKPVKYEGVRDEDLAKVDQLIAGLPRTFYQKGETQKQLGPSPARFPAKVEKKPKGRVRILKRIYYQPGEPQKRIEGAPERKLLPAKAELPSPLKVIADKYKFKFDGIQEGFEDLPETYQFTGLKGSGALGATLNPDVKGQTPEKLESILKKKIETFKKKPEIRKVAELPDPIWAVVKEHKLGYKGTGLGGHSFDVPETKSTITLKVEDESKPFALQKILREHFTQANLPNKAAQVRVREGKPGVGIKTLPRTEMKARKEEAELFKEKYQQKPVGPEALEMGDKITRSGEEFKVVEKTKGGVKLEDGGPDILVDTGDKVLVDKGKVTKVIKPEIIQLKVVVKPEVKKPAKAVEAEPEWKGGAETEQGFRGVRAKMTEQQITAFTESELGRVFRNVVTPKTAKRIANMMIEKGLTIEKLYEEVKAKPPKPKVTKVPKPEVTRPEAIAKPEVRESISFFDKNQAIRTGRLIDRTDKGAHILYNKEKIFVKNEQLKEKPEAKPTIETDVAKIQELKNSIAEGEMILRSGKTATGRKMSEGELGAVQRSVDKAKYRIGQTQPPTVKVPGAEHEQIVSPELLRQAKIPKGKIKVTGKVKPITGREGVGVFKRKEPGTEELFVKEPIVKYKGRLVKTEDAKAVMRSKAETAFVNSLAGVEKGKLKPYYKTTQHVYQKRQAFEHFLRSMGMSRKTYESQIDLFKRGRKTIVGAREYEKKLNKAIDDYLEKRTPFPTKEVPVPRGKVSVIRAEKPTEVRRVAEPRVPKVSELPLNKIKLSSLKVNDRYIDAKNGEVYVVTKKNPDGTIDVQDGKKRTLKGATPREIRGAVNGPETTFAGMQFHPLRILRRKLPKEKVPKLVPFSEKVYIKIKPSIEREWQLFSSIGKSYDKFVSQSIKKYGAGIREYLDKYKSEDPVQKLITALKKAKSLRKKQETIYTEERGKRLARSLAAGKKVRGEKGFYAELGQLKGELPKVQFESIRKEIGQKDIDNLFVKIKDSPLLSEWNKITARTALAKMLGEYGGRVPTEGEIALLNKVYGREFTSAILRKRTLIQRFKEAGYQLANIPRSLMASFDMSAPFRQGLFFIGRPKQFWRSFARMFKAFGSDRSFNAIQENIASRPTFELMNKSKLALTDMSSTLSTREEAFMSNWAEKIPLVGKVVRASGRAHLGFLNKLRADVFDDLIKKADNLGLNPKKDIDLSKAIAKLVNAGTGRGSLGSLERAAISLNTFLFSPRLTASRLTLLNPVYYIKQPPFVRKEALKSLFSLASIALTVLGLAKLMGAKVGKDPRNADFGKIKIGNTRIDILGGFQQYIRLAAQLITGKLISSTTGKTYTLGEGYKPLTRLDILARGVEFKTSPIMSFGINLVRGTTGIGEEFKVSREVGRRLIPMVAQDIYDIAKDDPNLLPVSLLAIYGVGLQTYGPMKKPIEPNLKGRPAVRVIAKSKPAVGVPAK